MFSFCFLLMFTGTPVLSTFSAWKPALWPGRHSLTLLDVRQGGGGLLFPGKVHLLGSKRLPGRARNKLGCLPAHSKAVIWQMWGSRRERTQQECGEAHLRDHFVQLCPLGVPWASWDPSTSFPLLTMLQEQQSIAEGKSGFAAFSLFGPGKMCAFRSELGEMLP